MLSNIKPQFFKYNEDAISEDGGLRSPPNLEKAISENQSVKGGYLNFKLDREISSSKKLFVSRSKSQSSEKVSGSRNRQFSMDDKLSAGLEDNNEERSQGPPSLFSPSGSV